MAIMDERSTKNFFPGVSNETSNERQRCLATDLEGKPLDDPNAETVDALPKVNASTLH
jgi:hypothetical protein